MTKNLVKLVMRSTGLVGTHTRNHRKTHQEIFEKRWKQKLTKNQNNTKYRNTSQQGGPFFTFSLPGGVARTPSPSSVAPLPTIENEKQDPFQFVSVWFWCSRCFRIPYVFNKHETRFLSFLIVVGLGKFERWKGRHFMVGSWQHLISLRHWCCTSFGDPVYNYTKKVRKVVVVIAKTGSCDGAF